MPFDVEKFQKAAAGLQSIVTTVGIVLAGAWAYYTFKELGAAQKAEAEIISLRQNASRVPVLQINMEPKQIQKALHSESPRQFAVAVKVKNDGNIALSVGTSVLEVVEINSETPGKPNIGKYPTLILRDDDLDVMPERLLRPGQARTMAVVVEVPWPGQYLLQLSTVHSAVDFQNGEIVKGEIRDGKFQPTQMAQILSIEQAVIDVQ